MAPYTGAGELPSMNARALLDYLPSWHREPTKQAKKEFPPEAYSYDDSIEKEVVAQIQIEANKTLDQQSWTVIERIGDGAKR
jgi:hypothetical protein